MFDVALSDLVHMKTRNCLSVESLQHQQPAHMSRVQVHFKYMLILVCLTVFIVYFTLNIILYLQIAGGFFSE